MPQKRLSMRKIEEILRLKYEVGLPHRAIAKSCGVSASTISEYVSRAKVAGIGWPLPEGLTAAELEEKLFPQAEGGNRRQIPQPDWKKVHQELKRKGVTLNLLWVEYRQAHENGYGYSQFCLKYGEWSKKLDPVMRQRHRPGEKLFVDYAGQTMGVTDPETGEVKEVQIFVATMGASNYTYAEAQWSTDLPSWIGGHVRTFAFLGGVPEVVVPDNLKAGVKSPHRYEPDLNPTYQDLARHYGVAVVPARVRKPKDKAKVEVGVQVVERWILARLRDRTFFSLYELNQAIKVHLQEINERIMSHVEASRQDLFERLDKPALKPLPTERYEFAIWKKAKVHLDYHVIFEKHYYSVPYQLIGKKVDIRATEKTIEIYYQRERQASHLRSKRKGRYSTSDDHMPAKHKAIHDWSPQRFINWAQKVGPCTQQLVTHLLDDRRHPEQAYRSCLGILNLTKQVTSTRLEAACKRAIAFGVESYKGVRNILDNKLDQVEVETPPEVPATNHANIRGQNYYH